MPQATITAYRGFLVFHHAASTQPHVLRPSIRALEIQHQTVQDTPRQLGVSVEALALLNAVTIKRFGAAANIAWVHDQGLPPELSWLGPAEFWARPGMLLAAPRTSIHGYLSISNDTAPELRVRIDAELDGKLQTTQHAERLAA